MKNRMQTETLNAGNVQMHNLTWNKMSELTDAELHAVSGGLNPQPLPPRVAFTALFTNSAVRAFQGVLAWG